ncbi:hypothetical protein FRC20_005479 [Serendipita sp. 405]|nr:hypothetical protein FRC20_005479 [Serendipita sp. 405]
MSHSPDRPKEQDSKHKFARLTSNPTRLKYAIRQLRITGPLEFMRDDVGINVTNVAGVMPPNVVLEAFRKVAEYSDWRTVEFEPFVHSLCVDVRGSLDHTNHGVRREPDLFIGFDTALSKELSTPTLEQPDSAGGYRGSISSIHTTHGIPVFIYRSSGGEMSCSSTDSSAEIEKKVTSHQRSQGVLANMLDYIFAYPWNMYPQAYSYCISITGKQLRLWKWEIDGCVATDLINYADDPTVLYQFLQFLGQGPYSKLGVDIGANELFKPIALTESIREKMDKIISLYCAARTPSEALEEWKKEVAKHCTLWTFRGWNAFEPDPAVYSQKIQTSVVVLSQPIYKNSHCYLALPGAQFQDFHLDDRSIADVNVFKTSWKLIDSAHELRCYKAIRQRVGSIKCLPTLLAGGVMQPYYSIRRVVEDYLDENEDKKKQERERSGKVQLDWSLLKEVGEDLMHCRSPAHLVQVMAGVFQGVSRIFPPNYLQTVPYQSSELTYDIEAYLDLNKARISYHNILPS